MKLRSTILFIILISSSSFAQDWFSAKKVTQHISILAADSLGGRATGSKFEEKAANYIIKQLKSNGIQPKGENGTWLQEFDFSAGLHGTGGRTGKANNVIGFLDNKAKNTIVIGAHYDHLGDGADGHSLDGHPEGKIHNGADDNASGIAVLLEVARVLKDYGNKKTLRFFATNGEEGGLYGAEHYAQLLKKNGEIKKLVLAINMDMVGYNSNGIVELETDSQYEKLANWFAGLATTYTSLKSKITIGAWGSDHVPFIQGGVPTLLTIEDWSTKTPCYHTECDKPSTLNYEYAGQIAKLNLAAIMTKDAE